MCFHVYESGHTCHGDCRDSTTTGASPTLFETGSLVYHFIVRLNGP